MYGLVITFSCIIFYSPNGLFGLTLWGTPLTVLCRTPYKKGQVQPIQKARTVKDPLRAYFRLTYNPGVYTHLCITF